MPRRSSWASPPPLFRKLLPASNDGLVRGRAVAMSLVNRLMRSAVSAAALALGAAPTAAVAGGFYLQEQSVKGLGRAYSGEVADECVEAGFVARGE